jgi:pimeloyl-ACP methyl ester carboxylesterase
MFTALYKYPHSAANYILITLLAVSTACDVNKPDETPPTVEITFPVEGMTIAGPVLIAANVSDNEGIGSVTFLVDGVVMDEDSEYPYEYTWQAFYWSDNANHTIQVEAIDESGNVGTSDIINVLVADSAQVSFTALAPAQGALVVDNQAVRIRWRTIPEAQVYSIQIASDSAFADIISEAVQSDTIIVRTLDPGTYYWRVQACNSGELWSPWSRFSMFEVVQVTSGYLSVTFGTLYYEEAGDGPPLVLIHSGYVDRRMWNTQFATLSRDYRVIRYDARAHGLSTDIEPASFSDHDDLWRLLRRLGVSQAILVGSSLGTNIATSLTLTYPEMVSALVMVSPGLGGHSYSSPEHTQYVNDVLGALAVSDWEGIADAIIKWYCVGPYRTASDMNASVRNQVYNMLIAHHLRWDYLRYIEYLDPPPFDRLEEIDVPVLTVVGDLDMPGVLDLANRINSRVPNAQMVTLNGAAHMVNMELPAEFNQVLLSFLEQL